MSTREAVTLENAGLRLSFDTVTGALAAIIRGAGGSPVSAVGHAASFSLQTGGTFVYVRDTSMNSEIDNGRQEVLALRMTGHTLVDAGEASALVIDQEGRGWKLSTRYELDHRAPVLTVTWTLEHTGKGSTTLDGVAWTLPTLRLAEQAVPAWADIGASPVRVFALQDSGLAVFWRSAEGDYAVVERADDTVRFALHMGGRVEPGTRMSGGGLRMAFVPDTGAAAVQEQA